MDELLDFLDEHPEIDLRMNATTLPWRQDSNRPVVRICMTSLCLDRNGDVEYDAYKRVSRWYSKEDILERGAGETLEEMLSLLDDSRKFAL